MIKINEEIYKEALPYIAEALMRSGVMASDIEQIYRKDEVEYCTLYKDFAGQKDDRLLISGTLEREISLKHCLGVLLAAERKEQTKLILMKRCSSNYSELFLMAKKASNKLYSWVIQKYRHEKTEIANAFARIGYYFLILTHGMEFEAPASIKEFVQLMESDVVKMRKYNHLGEAFDNSIQKNIKEVSTILQKYAAVKSCADIRFIMDEIEIFSEGNGFRKTDSQVVGPYREVLQEVYLTAAGLMDAKDMSFSLLLEGHHLEKRDLQLLALLIHRVQEKRKKAGAVYNESERDAFLYCMGIIFLSVLKEYGNAKNLYNEKLDHEILVENKGLIKKNEQLQQDNQVLKQEVVTCHQNIAALKQRTSREYFETTRQDKLIELRNSLQKLQQEKEQWEADRYDYNRLKELAFELESDGAVAAPKSSDIHCILKNHRIFVFGGHETWHQQLRKEFPELRLVSGTLHSISPEVFQSAEYVLIFSGHMAHTVFDKGTAFLRKNGIPYGYLSQCNLELLKEKILKIYEEDQK